MFRAVLFDLDGTLANTALDLTVALNYVLAIADKPLLDYKTVRPYAAYGSSKMMDLGFGEEATPEMQSIFLDYYQAHVADETVLFEGMSDVLMHLKSAQIPIAVVTNKPSRFSEPLLLVLNVEADCVVSGDTYLHRKPHPMPILEACKSMAVEPADCLFVGDSQVDVKAANAADMPVVVANYGYLSESADEIAFWDIFGCIDAPTDLMQWL